MGGRDESVEIRENGRAQEGCIGNDAEVTTQIRKTPDTGHDPWKGGEESSVGNAGTNARVKSVEDYQKSHRMVYT